MQPQFLSNEQRVRMVAEGLKGTGRRLVVIWRGAAYTRPAGALKDPIDMTKIPFPPTLQGKGVLLDDHLRNTSAARLHCPCWYKGCPPCGSPAKLDPALWQAATMVRGSTHYPNRHNP
ncbi:unnamed protein product [Tuber aestivum]|uniref:Uncharacterized protein n=1 Tax=Tuber aestivum TaxID=59557 RepID=A0A292PKI0_9PEZI|nr:unnamed protein product [Tuber aestivum]